MHLRSAKAATSGERPKTMFWRNLRTGRLHRGAGEARFTLCGRTIADGLYAAAGPEAEGRRCARCEAIADADRQVSMAGLLDEIAKWWHETMRRRIARPLDGKVPTTIKAWWEQSVAVPYESLDPLERQRLREVAASLLPVLRRQGWRARSAGWEARERQGESAAGPPAVIWLQWYGPDRPADHGEEGPALNEVTWAPEPVFEHDVPYVRAG